MQQGKVDKSKEQYHNCRPQLPHTRSITQVHKLLFHQSISIISFYGTMYRSVNRKKKLPKLANKMHSLKGEGHKSRRKFSDSLKTPFTQ